eukprot:913865_1
MNCPWKLTVTTTNNKIESYFTRDERYKSYIRWQTQLQKLTDVSNISNLKVEKSNKLSLAPNDSFTVILKIRGIAEKQMGTISCVTPVVHYNPTPWCMCMRNHLEFHPQTHINLRRTITIYL